MTVFQKAVTGFNNNVPRKGRSYHVQTEDSGIKHPHIMTHLFLGGNIIASQKTSYRDILDAPDLAERVRAMMDEQHKEMIRNLLAGKYDAQAAQSVQLHAPKAEMLTPHQAPVCAAALEAVPRAAPSDPPPPSGDLEERSIAHQLPDEMPPSSPLPRPQIAAPAPAPSAGSPMTAEARLRAALVDYLNHARATVNRALGH